jgi:hypothetical protein
MRQELTMIAIELYGMPRLRAGVGRLDVEATTVAEALLGLLRAFPTLEGSVLQGRGVHPAYRLSINGDRFVTNLETPLEDGDALLVLTADIGG